MSHYGHPLRFGLALNSADPATLIEHAVLADTLGYDSVSVDESSPLEVWSSLSWIAGRTERIRLLPVVNLNLHSPAVLGRAAASLDLLSGGRLELGLTAEDADAVDEAITIIRDLWMAGEPGRVRHVGAHYRVEGADRGPTPAHGIPILVQGTGERMLRMIGSSAEGWLVRYPAPLESGNRVVDSAAENAG